MRQALNHSYRFPQRAESVRTLCIRLPKVVLFLFLLLGAGSLAAQNTDQQIAAQKRLIADLEKQLNTAPTAIPAPDPQALRDKIIAAIPTLKDPDVTPTVKNNLLRCFISKIVYTKSNEEIEMYYYM